MPNNEKLIVFLLFLILCVGCLQNNKETSLTETREAENYPWEFYPIDKDSQMALCQALSLPNDDRMCQTEQDIMFRRDVVRKIEEIFPVEQTLYTEVEDRLSEFPHYIQENRGPDDRLISLTYVYQLTSYEGACIYFFTDSKDMTTIERISASHLDSGPPSTKCGPSQ